MYNFVNIYNVAGDLWVLIDGFNPWFLCKQMFLWLAVLHVNETIPDNNEQWINKHHHKQQKDI